MLQYYELPANRYSSLNNPNLVPFLRLPIELRLQIYQYLLGGNLIHMTYQHHGPGKRPQLIKRFQYALCQYPLSEEHIYGEFQAGHGPEENTQTVRDMRLPPWPENVQQSLLKLRGAAFKDRHAWCKPWPVLYFTNPSSPPQCSQEHGRRLNLEVLHTCRQLYDEASTVLWNANTFSFEDWGDFRAFISPRNVPPRTKLSKLHIDTHWHRKELESWSRLLNPYRLKKIPGVHTLHLTIEVDPQGAKVNPFVEKPFYQTRRLDLKYVTCVIRKTVPRFMPWFDDGTDLTRQTLEERRQAAEEMRSMLLKPYHKRV